jgi:penicillin-binding protein 1A
MSGGAAPARAFAAYMRYAVQDRPAEEFDTELQLPEWQLEPDDEFYYGDPGEYYYIDEQGNLVEPGRPSFDDGFEGFDVEGEYLDDPGVEDMGLPLPPPAASDDFLEQATGGEVQREGTSPRIVTIRRGTNEPAGVP